MSLSGSQITSAGGWGGHLAYAGFTAKAMAGWQDVVTNASAWYCQNPTETTWDTDATFWDLDGNVYVTLWDNQDDTWSDA